MRKVIAILLFLDYLLWPGIIYEITPGPRMIWVDARNGKDGQCVSTRLVTGPAERTIQGALKCMQSGDTLIIRSGNYEMEK